MKYYVKLAGVLYQTWSLYSTWNYIFICLPCLCADRYQTGSGTRESDTRKTLANSKKRPTCTQPGLRSMPPVCLPTAARRTLHPPLTRQVRPAARCNVLCRLRYISRTATVMTSLWNTIKGSETPVATQEFSLWCSSV